MKAKRYDGYRSRRYGDADVDDRDHKLARAIGRVPSHRPELTAGLAASGLDAVFDNFMDGTAMVRSPRAGSGTTSSTTSPCATATSPVKDSASRRERTAAVRPARASDRIGCVSTIEGAALIENELDRLDILLGFGVRCRGVGYSAANALGCGRRDPHDSALTVFGEQAGRRMNKLGCAIDVSRMPGCRARAVARAGRRSAYGCRPASSAASKARRRSAARARPPVAARMDSTHAAQRPSSSGRPATYAAHSSVQAAWPRAATSTTLIPGAQWGATPTSRARR
jgi:hypothetical protein